VQALKLKKPPLVILMTAWGREEMLKEAESIGRHEILVKPISPAMLLLAAIAGARVLLVEDNDINQIVASEILSDAGLVVDIADDGRIALEMVQAQPYDLVL